MKLVCIFFAVVLIALPKVPDTPEVQAQLLDRNEYRCDNCFFGAATYYYCFAADNKVLIGYEKIPTMNWIDPSKDWLTKVHKSWQPNRTIEGQTVPIRYDEKHIWLTGPTGKPVRLTQDYSTDIFLNNRQCRAAVKKK